MDSDATLLNFKFELGKIFANIKIRWLYEEGKH